MLIVPVLSRINSVVNCTFEPYARASGMGKTFVDNTDGMGLGISYLTVTVFLYLVSSYFNLPFISLFIILNIMTAIGFFFGKLITKKIGGITGDTLGALLELSSVLSLVLMYVML